MQHAQIEELLVILVMRSIVVQHIGNNTLDSASVEDSIVVSEVEILIN